jgi:hypothetical protein
MVEMTQLADLSPDSVPDFGQWRVSSLISGPIRADTMRVTPVER